MIIFNDIEAIKQFAQIELRQHILETISKITEGATYDPSIYGQFALVEAGDSIAEIEAATGCQVIHDLFNESRYGDAEFMPSFEWLVEHPSFYEAVFIFSDDGFGVDLLIPKASGIDAELLAMCAEYAVPA
ncbi:MAG: hypothetical protein Q8Q57_04755 [Methylotenera sp.]|nr:hypothetical protein [Methylotenera sp.]